MTTETLEEGANPSVPPTPRVWKVGSRWSEHGCPNSSILDVFRRNRIVFVGSGQHLFERILEGDIVAISDGVMVVALGRVASPPRRLSEFPLELTSTEAEWIALGDDVLACRVDYQDLDPRNHFYGGRRTIHRLYQMAGTALALYQANHQKYEEKQQFEIKARSCTLADNHVVPTDVLWQPETRFRIPIFQRPYSWGEAEVKRLLSDLLTAHFGRNGRPQNEPMFIGTMQLTSAVSVDDGGFKRQHDIIDGQQRLTSLALLLRELEARSPQDSLWQQHGFRPDQLITMVEQGTQQIYLKTALALNVDTDGLNNGLNTYLSNRLLISALLDEDEDIRDSPEKIIELANYILSQVYFVIIETRATLSKTIQIFDAINTSGLDLNGSDVFKIRFYEYLREFQSVEEKVFDEICELYGRIAEGNRKAGWGITSMEDVLGLAQQILITEYDFAASTRQLRSTTFFDRLFDVVLNLQQWRDFPRDKCLGVKLEVQFLSDVIESRFAWEDAAANLRPEARAMWWFTDWTRYSRYSVAYPYFYHRYRPGKEELEMFIIAYTKMLSVYSLINKRTTYAGHAAAHDVMAELATAKGNPIETIIAFVSKNCATRKSDLNRCLMDEELAGNRTWKNLVCRLVAMQEELEEEPDPEALVQLLFRTHLEIEHIEAANHKDLVMREQIQREWSSELHQLGNLTVLEFELNRKISNGDYAGVKRTQYTDSKFRAVRTFAEEHENWNLEKAQERKRVLAERITNYLCGPSIPDSPNFPS